MVMIVSKDAAQTSQNDIHALLPIDGEVPGSIAADSARVFKGEELYHFIDGGADLFFEYGFRRVIAQEYAGRSAIKLEIYEMTDAGAAYGIYSIRSGENAESLEIGEGGCRTSYYVMFRKGRYYVSVASRDTSRDATGTVEAIARAVDQKISDRGGLPLLATMLRDEHPSRLIYFKGPLGLGTAYYFDERIAFHAEEGIAGMFKDHMTIVFRYKDSVGSQKDFVWIDSLFKTSSRYSGYRVQENIVLARDKSKQTLCFGAKGAHLIAAIAQNEKVAEEACKRKLHRGL
jgi:hypothetical protein